MQPNRAAKRKNRDRPTSNTEHGTEVIAISPAAKHYFLTALFFSLLPFARRAENAGWGRDCAPASASVVHVGAASHPPADGGALITFCLFSGRLSYPASDHKKLSV